MGQASSDKSPTGINCHKTEGRDECLSGKGKSRNKDSERAIQGPGSEPAYVEVGVGKN